MSRKPLVGAEPRGLVMVLMPAGRATRRLLPP